MDEGLGTAVFPIAEGEVREPSPKADNKVMQEESTSKNAAIDASSRTEVVSDSFDSSFSHGFGSRIAIAAIIGLLAFVMYIASQPIYEVSAANDTPTPTPVFKWTVNDPTTGNTLEVDPFSRTVTFRAPRGAAPTVVIASVPDMFVSKRRVTWKWNNPERDVLIWGTIDRARLDVRATLWRKAKPRPLVDRLNVKPASSVLALPSAPDPFVIIRDLQLLPRTKIIRSTEQLSFQNESLGPCSIAFDQAPGKSPAANTSDFDLGVIQPGRVSRLFPRAVVSLSPTPTPDTTGGSALKPQMWRTGVNFSYTVQCGEIQRVGFVVVQE